MIQVLNLASDHVGLLVPQKPGDVGYDLVVSEDVVISHSGGAILVPCGVAVKLPRGFWGLITGRSSAIMRHGLFVVPSIIDQGYVGPICACVLNIRKHSVHLKRGDRVAQLVLIRKITPHIRPVRALPRTVRGSTGFGSTNKAK